MQLGWNGKVARLSSVRYMVAMRGKHECAGEAIIQSEEDTV